MAYEINMASVHDDYVDIYDYITGNLIESIGVQA
jgi:hypothetical protein